MKLEDGSGQNQERVSAEGRARSRSQRQGEPAASGLSSVCAALEQEGVCVSCVCVLCACSCVTCDVMTCVRFTKLAGGP